MNSAGDACAVATGTCTFVAGYTPTCDLDVATDSSALCAAGCATMDDVCEPVTAAATCTAQASNGESACTTAGDCTYDDGSADDVCETISKSYTGDALYMS